MHAIALHLALIQAADEINLRPLKLTRHVLVLDVLHRRPRRGVLLQKRRIQVRKLRSTDLRALTNRRQKRAAIVLRAAVVRRRVQRDKTRQIVILRAQPVKRPRPHRRPHKLKTARVHLHERLRMIRQIRVRRVDDAKVIRVLCEMRIQTRDPLT